MGFVKQITKKFSRQGRKMASAVQNVVQPSATNRRQQNAQKRQQSLQRKNQIWKERQAAEQANKEKSLRRKSDENRFKDVKDMSDAEFEFYMRNADDDTYWQFQAKRGIYPELDSGFYNDRYSSDDDGVTSDDGDYDDYYYEDEDEWYDY